MAHKKMVFDAEIDIIVLNCPNCKGKIVVHHLNWCAIVCVHCDVAIFNPLHDSLQKGGYYDELRDEFITKKGIL
jgi:hypothetical protein